MMIIDFDLGEGGINGTVDGFLKLGIESLGCCLVTEIRRLVGGNEIPIEGKRDDI